MYTIKLEQFNGPFDLLLGLIEKEKLDITDISLAQVVDEFLSYIDQVERVRTQELADFLEIAAKLILFKSKLLILDPSLDDEEVDDLVGQLKIYREFALISKKVSDLAARPYYSFGREKIPVNISASFSQDLDIKPETLEKNFNNIVSIILKQVKLSQKIIKRKIISLKDKINELMELVKEQQQFILNHLIKHKNKIEQAVIFLASLELMKQNKIEIEQEELFGDIIIKRKSNESKT